MTKPTIAELEALLNSEDDTPVTIHADGSVTNDLTNALPDPNYRSPDDIVRAILAFAKGPRLIGNMMGLLVYVDNSLPPGMIEFRHTDGRVQRVNIDHPYIQGTKLEAEARRALVSVMPMT